PPPIRALGNTAETPTAKQVTFQPVTFAKSDISCHFKSINSHFLSSSAAPCQRQSVSPIADRHLRIARDCIGTRYAYIPRARAVSHGCRRTEAVGPRGT